MSYKRPVPNQDSSSSYPSKKITGAGTSSHSKPSPHLGPSPSSHVLFKAIGGGTKRIIPTCFAPMRPNPAQNDQHKNIAKIEAFPPSDNSRTQLDPSSSKALPLLMDQAFDQAPLNSENQPNKLYINSIPAMNKANRIAANHIEELSSYSPSRQPAPTYQTSTIDPPPSFSKKKIYLCPSLTKQMNTMPYHLPIMTQLELQSNINLSSLFSSHYVTDLLDHSHSISPSQASLSLDMWIHFYQFPSTLIPWHVPDSSIGLPHSSHQAWITSIEQFKRQWWNAVEDILLQLNRRSDQAYVLFDHFTLLVTSLDTFSVQSIPSSTTINNPSPNPNPNGNYECIEVNSKDQWQQLLHHEIYVVVNKSTSSLRQTLITNKIDFSMPFVKSPSSSPSDMSSNGFWKTSNSFKSSIDFHHCPPCHSSLIIQGTDTCRKLFHCLTEYHLSKHSGGLNGHGSSMPVVASEHPFLHGSLMRLSHQFSTAQLVQSDGLIRHLHTLIIQASWILPQSYRKLLEFLQHQLMMRQDTSNNNAVIKVKFTPKESSEYLQNGAQWVDSRCTNPIPISLENEAHSKEIITTISGSQYDDKLQMNDPMANREGPYRELVIKNQPNREQPNDDHLISSQGLTCDADGKPDLDAIGQNKLIREANLADVRMINSSQQELHCYAIEIITLHHQGFLIESKLSEHCHDH